jgi:hypothetical protein
MDYDNNRSLREQSSQAIATGIGIILTAPLFALSGLLIIGAMLPTIAIQAYAAICALFVLLGVASTATGIRSRIAARKQNQNR